jgi:hypothetical protein
MKTHKTKIQDISEVITPSVIEIHNIYLDKGRFTKHSNYSGIIYLAIVEDSLGADRFRAEGRGDKLEANRLGKSYNGMGFLPNKSAIAYVVELQEWLDDYIAIYNENDDWEDKDPFIHLIEQTTGYCVNGYDIRLDNDLDYLCYLDLKRQAKRHDLISSLLD